MPGAGSQQTQADADAVRQDRIGENCQAGEAQKDRRMTNPGGGHLLLFPIAQIWSKFCRGRWIQSIQNAHASAPAAEEIGAAQRQRPSFRPICVTSPGQCPFTPNSPNIPYAAA